MRTVKTDKTLHAIEKRVFAHAEEMGRTLPELRFFILDSAEFMSLLSKKVYPVSPVNIWEGKEVVRKRYRVEAGLESSLYYEVVQTGNPSYAYLNETNSDTMQASVMAHVIGHCEFSELNVMHDSNSDRTERVMYLVRKVEHGRRQMGERIYTAYWNACESVMSMIAPNSQFNLNRSVESDVPHHDGRDTDELLQDDTPLQLPASSTLEALLQDADTTRREQKNTGQPDQREARSRRGYTLRAPCQDVGGFLRHYAPTSAAERSILDYMYVTHEPHDFVVRTQIMNEGWAMYWEKKIMLELFNERIVKDVIDYAKVFSGVCYPRPFFSRNPYHLGYHMWNHVERLYRDGKVSLDYIEETDMERKKQWKRESDINPIAAMEHLVRSVTDYEFLRRFLTLELVEEFHLNRIAKQQAKAIGIKASDVVREDPRWVWLNPEPVKEEMLQFFTHLHRPRIYIVDTDFLEGGLLLFHRDDGRALRKDWIKPTLKNLNLIWKGSVHLLTKDTLYGYSASQYRESKVRAPSFDDICQRMFDGKKPFIKA